MNPLFLGSEALTEFEINDRSETDYGEFIVKYHGDISKIEPFLNATVEILNSNYAIVTLPLGRVAELYGFPEVEYIERPKRLMFFVRLNSNYACITPVQRETNFGLRGNGTIVAILDSGIDYTHPDFINPDGTSRILYLWDQSIPGSPPAGFQYGTEYTNAQLNEALASPQPLSVVPSVDRVGHGTAVAGIAASNGRASRGVDFGVAPEASLIVVKLGRTDAESFTRTTEVMRALKYVIDKAEELNMPITVNLSYGTNNGAHDGLSLFESFINDMSERWKTVISSATGNEGSAGHHFYGNLSQGEVLDVEFVTDGSVPTMYLSMWKNFADLFTIELISPSGRSTGIIQPIQSITRLTLDGVLISVLYGQPTHYSTNQEIYILMQARQGSIIPAGVWRLSVSGRDVVVGDFDIWLPTVEDVGTRTAFLRPEVDMTMTLPSTALNVISVGGYQGSTNIAADFSGRGSFRRIFPIKPDLVAPAVNIRTTAPNGGYTVVSGTSMATPFVTGSAALIMEWGIVKGNAPFLYGQRVKAFLQKGAARDALVIYPNPIWGYGRLSLCDTMDYIVEYTQQGGSIS